MRLAKLTLVGFKSFADRTEFVFDAPVTGVVGPNGCGKSNVVDAIKWVLGERSAKSLRSKEMADVIFAGSGGRKPMGLASVTLTFENPLLDAEVLPSEGLPGADPFAIEGISEPAHAEEAPEPIDEGEERAFERPLVRRRSLPIDVETVDVERRLHRDGTSEYLINGRKARLRDIRELFLDTGVGADAYSIIEQGKVDAMLLASPTERRTIFEEAAGVAKFKARRIESQRKLERAEQSLLVLREQLATAERRLRIVKGQAAKARRFQELETRSRGLRMAVAFDQHHELRMRLDGLTSRLQQLETERAGAAGELAAAEEEKQLAELSRQELHQAIRAHEASLAEARHEGLSAEQRRAFAQRALEEARRQAETDRARLSEVEQRVERLDTAMRELDASIDSLAGRVAQAEEGARAAGEERAASATTLAEKRAELSERLAGAGRIDRDRASLLARAEGERRRIATLQEQAAATGARVATIERERADAAERVRQAGEAIATRRAAVNAAEHRLKSTEESAGALAGDQRQLTERIGGLERARATADGRRATLQELIDARAGFGDAVRAVLELRDRQGADGPFGAVLAPLAELLEADAEYAPAVEAALAADLQALVVQSATDLIDRGGVRSLPGRVTFLPASGASDATGVAHFDDLLAEAIGVPEGSMISLRSVVRVDDRAAGLVDRLLGHAFLVESAESALMLGAAMRARGVRDARFVTRSGEVLDADGRIVAGPAGAGESAGVLQRKTELAALAAQLEGLESELIEARVSLASIDQKSAELDAALAGARRDLAGEQRALVADQALEDRGRAELDRLERELPRLREELESTGQRIADVEREQEELTAKAESLARLHAEQTEIATALQTAIVELQRATEAASERLSAMRVEVTQRSDALGGARRELRRAELEREQAVAERGRLEEHEARSREKTREHEATIAEAVESIQKAAWRGAELENKLGELAGSLEEADRLSMDLGERVVAARHRSGIVERDWNSVELSRREVEVRRETLEQRATEDLALDLAAEAGEYAQLMSTGEVARIDTDAVTAEIDGLREEIRRLGNVNLDAIEEETQLESRNEELVRQVADIDAARAQLEELITRLSDLSRERFKSTFEAIQQHFGGDDGMFRRLFGGGKADVRLMPNPETGEVDWLESGVEVVAKPPGKEPRTISQLSGGEKTLTAISLLLAIFKSKPSPFCILDEVDAALDEANVGRFCATTRQFVEHSQIIVITHNKRTMQSCDQLFGVTMQERGVSTRVHVKLDQVGANGEIREGRRAKSAAAEPAAEPAPVDAHSNGPEPTNGEAPRPAARQRPSLREQLAAMRNEGEPAQA